MMNQEGSTDGSDGETMPIMETDRNFRVLKNADIQKYQQDDVTLVSNTLCISPIAAAILLPYYAWNVDKLQDAWFDDEERVRESVGLHNKPAAAVGFRKYGESLVCDICFETYVFDTEFGNTVDFCGHSFCSACLEAYVSKAIDDGPRCLFLRCPDLSCGAAIGEDMVNLLVSVEGKIKYKEFFLRSYVDSNKKIKWCPAPDCEHAIENQLGSQKNYDVVCECSFSFCWNCLEDSHHPLDCETVAKWMLKNSCESENVTWILANCRPCPFCNVPIEKIEVGCKHITCLCGYEFCWDCLRLYNTDHKKTACDRYMAKSDDEKVRDRAKIYSMKYIHYYERWAANYKLRRLAIEALADLRETKTEELLQQGDLKYVKEAWEQIVECRRLLKWTYAYGYHMSEASSNKKLLEWSQGKAEVASEWLNVCAQAMHKKLFTVDRTTFEFTHIRNELIHQTCVTRIYIEKLAKGVSNQWPLGPAVSPSLSLRDVKGSNLVKDKEGCVGVFCPQELEKEAMHKNRKRKQ